MTQLLGELGGTARDIARTGLAVTVVLALALGITVARALSPSEHPANPDPLQ